MRTIMARSTRAAASSTPRRETPWRAARAEAESAANAKEEENETPMKSTQTRKRTAPKAACETPKKIKVELEKNWTTSTSTTPAVATPPAKKQKPASQKSTPAELQARKLKAYAAYANASPFPSFVHPTPSEAKLAHKILAALHGARTRPAAVVAPSNRAGCGDSPSVLDALVRTVLSQNTSDTNSSRAKQRMDAMYGRSDRWDAIVAGGRDKLQAAIKCGGLSVVKSRVIISILEQVHARYGVYSLDHLHAASSEEAMREMLSFQGVGPKTASCVLLFCLRRESFAVDTHVYRITGLLGWRPPGATREETHAHLDARIPDEDKFGLHILLVSHGKKCGECKAGGKSSGTCELRKAFRQGKLHGEAGDEVKEEEAAVKHEDTPYLGTGRP